MGIRCDKHVGEVFPPRCFDCDLAVLNHSADLISDRLGFIPGSECRMHPGYPLPCVSCGRTAGEVA